MKKSIILLIVLLIACDGGLKPPDPVEVQLNTSLIKGVVTYVNGKDHWPSADSVKDIRIVAFKELPAKDSAALIKAVADGEAIFSPDSLPYFVDSSSFALEIKEPPQEFKYICVAWNYAGLFDWMVIGIYTLSGDNTKPSSLFVEKGITYDSININVDFNNLPPQPYE